MKADACKGVALLRRPNFYLTRQGLCSTCKDLGF